MNPEDFLDTAATLLLNARESDQRSCVSRAYYSVYHMLREVLLNTLPLTLLQSSGMGSKNQISHDKLPSALKNSSDPAIAEIGEQLLMLNVERTRADYQLDRPVVKNNARVQYENATDLRDDLKAYGLSKLAQALKSDLEKTFRASP